MNGKLGVQRELRQIIGEETIGVGRLKWVFWGEKREGTKTRRVKGERH